MLAQLSDVRSKVREHQAETGEDAEGPNRQRAEVKKALRKLGTTGTTWTR